MVLTYHLKCTFPELNGSQKIYLYINCIFSFQQESDFVIFKMLSFAYFCQETCMANSQVYFMKEKNIDMDTVPYSKIPG